MVDRIRALLLARQLSPTQFADAIGVARPIVSHIMSGRNKPSLEVVQKILAAFPDLSMPWLLNGSGPMLAPTAVPTAAQKAPAAASAPPRRRLVAPPVPTDLASALPAREAADSRGPALEIEVPAAPTGGAPRPLPELAVPVASAVPAAAGAAVPAVGAPPELALFAEPGKAIRRIVIFYRDGTFSDYQPE